MWERPASRSRSPLSIEFLLNGAPGNNNDIHSEKKNNSRSESPGAVPDSISSSSPSSYSSFSSTLGYALGEQRSPKDYFVHGSSSSATDTETSSDTQRMLPSCSSLISELFLKDYPHSTPSDIDQSSFSTSSPSSSPSRSASFSSPSSFSFSYQDPSQSSSPIHFASPGTSPCPSSPIVHASSPPPPLAFAGWLRDQSRFPQQQQQHHKKCSDRHISCTSKQTTTTTTTDNRIKLPTPIKPVPSSKTKYATSSSSLSSCGAPSSRSGWCPEQSQMRNSHKSSIQGDDTKRAEQLDKILSEETLASLGLLPTTQEDADSAHRDDSDKPPKRKQATPKQVAILEQIFAIEPIPSCVTKIRLSKLLGISPKKVQIWFKNKRARQKKGKPKREPFTFHYFGAQSEHQQAMDSSSSLTTTTPPTPTPSSLHLQ